MVLSVGCAGDDSGEDSASFTGTDTDHLDTGDADTDSGRTQLTDSGTTSLDPDETLDGPAFARVIGDVGVPYWGMSVALPGDLDGDGEDDIALPHWMAQGSDQVGKLAFAFGPFSGDVTLSESGTFADGPDLDLREYAGLGDASGDGLADVAVEDANRAEVLVICGHESRSVNLSAPCAVIEMVSIWALASPGDLDSDGVTELVVGDPGAMLDGPCCGSAHLFRGPLAGRLEIEDAHWSVYGREEYEFMGSAVSAGGDVTGDGFVDVVVGTNNDLYASKNAGGVYLFEGPLSGIQAADDAIDRYKAWGEGRQVHNSADLDGDGYVDVVCSIDDTDDAGTGVFSVFAGDSDGASLADGDAVARLIDPERNYDEMRAVGLPDVDADGADELVITPFLEHADQFLGHPSVYVFHGELSGTIALMDAATILYKDFDTSSPGATPSIGPDLNADDIRDLALGTPYLSEGELHGGGIYLLSGAEL